MTQSAKTIGIGLLGLGTVGQGVVEILQKSSDSISKSLNASLVLRKIAVRDLDKERPGLELDKSLFTTSIEEVVRHPEVNIVVEVMGGVDEARYAVLEALENEKSVVSANKALIAQHGKELFELAHKKQRDFIFEAAVGGGIPIVRVLRESFMGNKIHLLMGIVNGTSNYILSAMTEAFEKGEVDAGFASFLKKAQEKGYAEADTTMDIDGTDAVQKLAILSSLAFGGWVDYRKIYKDGITQLDIIDFEMAEYFHYRIKLLGIAKLGDKGLDLRVHPTLLPKQRLLADVNGVFNAFYVKGEPIGASMLYGRGAGGGPTASVVVSDIIDIARNLLSASTARVPILPLAETPIKELQLANMKNLVSRYYCRLAVVDRPGALALITQILGQKSISISSLIQKERSKLTPVPVVFLTHEAKEKNVQEALEAIDQLDVVVDRPLIIRIEE